MASVGFIVAVAGEPVLCHCGLLEFRKDFRFEFDQFCLDFFVYVARL